MTEETPEEKTTTEFGLIQHELGESHVLGCLLEKGANTPNWREKMGEEIQSLKGDVPPFGLS